MISLKNYIKRRNGVPLGHSNSLGNMLKRSLGAKSFDLFWVHWNPIWNYYLNKYIYRALKRISHSYLAVVITFCFSGFVHDLVTLLIYRQTSFFITVWFTIMGMIVVISKLNNIQYSKYSTITIYTINIVTLLGSLCLTRTLMLILTL